MTDQNPFGGLSKSEFNMALRAARRAAEEGGDERDMVRAAELAVKRAKDPNAPNKTGGFK